MKDYELKFVKIQFLVKSISPWKQYTKNFEIDKMNFIAYFECKTLTTFTLKCIIKIFYQIKGREIWNNLTIFIETSESFNIFKKKIKKYYIDLLW